jgi:carbonic anhydrase/acetyltransferase-like protein (isoleucine patch superfamily)
MLIYSVGDLIDKFITAHQKIWHLEENIQKARENNEDAEKITKMLDQVVSLNKLREDIKLSLNEILSEKKKEALLAVLIAGDGSLSRVLSDMLKEFEVVGSIMLKRNSQKEIYTSIRTHPEKLSVILGVLNPIFKKEFVDFLGENRIVTVRDGKISESSTIGHGSVIMTDSYIMNQARIEKYVHVHTGAIVGHDTTIGKYSSIGPQSVIGGNCKIGENCRLGMGSIILPGTILKDNTTVAAGAVVLESYPVRTDPRYTVYTEGMVLAGNPATVIGKTDFSKF